MILQDYKLVIEISVLKCINASRIKIFYNRPLYRFKSLLKITLHFDIEMKAFSTSDYDVFTAYHKYFRKTEALKMQVLLTAYSFLLKKMLLS